MTERIASYNGARVREVLDAQGIRQDWLASQAGISRAHLSRIVRGERLATRPVAERIAAALRVPFSLAFELPIGSKLQPIGDDDALDATHHAIAGSESELARIADRADAA